MPPIVVIAVCEVSPVLATKHDFAGRMLSVSKAKRAWVKTYTILFLTEAGDALYAVT